MIEESAIHVSFKNALNSGPPPVGNLAIPIFKHGSMEAELYTPLEMDQQKPHKRDEIYIVARGAGKFFNGAEYVLVQEQSFIFVPAGVEHRFEEFTQDFAVWVIFYGPEGGER